MTTRAARCAIATALLTRPASRCPAFAKTVVVPISLRAPAALQAIAEALDANKTLKVLGMSGNEIEDKVLRKKCRSRKA